MCGLVGFIDFKCNTPQSAIEEMVATLQHRGPNDCGSEIISRSDYQIALGHTRLSIIDLTSGGHQPMHFEEISILFNGEIYNYREIKQELIANGHMFQTESDTEVILHAYKQWGTKCVNRFIGMFAIVLYDRTKESFTLISDRANVKPLYYYWSDELFLFSSELKAFHKHPRFSAKIDNNAVYSFFENIHYGYIAAPNTIFESAKKMNQASIIEFSFLTKEISEEKYWNVSNYYDLPKLEISYTEAKDHLSQLLHSACNYRMVSDVPVGVFLSGGYDSSAVASILQSERSEKLKTFTIGFQEGNNEAPFAQDIAKKLGTEHYEYICTTKEAQSIIPTLPYYYDEPFADSSAIPTMLVSRIAKQEVTVALSADGGDEVFGGYNSYRTLEIKNKILNSLPSAFKKEISNGLKILTTRMNIMKPEVGHQLNTLVNSLNVDKYIQKNQLVQNTNKLPDYYLKNLFSNEVYQTSKIDFNDSKKWNSIVELAMVTDYKNYLPDDILTKVDRATMSVSLEGREPLLDHRIIEFAAQLPLNYKYYKGKGKLILRDIVHDYLSKQMMDRPKTGFTLPIYTWLRGDLSHLLDKYLGEVALKESGLFNVEFVLNQVKLFKVSELHYTPLIWKLLMFQMWYFEWILGDNQN